MKIAIIHDEFLVYGGAEFLVINMARGLNADVYTYSISKSVRKIIPKEVKVFPLNKKEDWDPSGINKTKAFSKLNLKNKYDLFIFSGNSCLIAANKNKPNIWYCNTPPREEFDTEFARYYDEGIGKWTEEEIGNKPFPERLSKKIIFSKRLSDRIKIFSPHLNQKLSLLDCYRYGFTRDRNIKYVKNIQKIISNSKNIKNRVKYAYKRESSVINPSINTSDYYYKKNKDYWLSVNRIHLFKRITLQLKAFEKMPEERLLIIGGVLEGNSYYEKLLKKITPKNVKFLGEISEKEKFKLLSECKGMIFTAFNEDFGISPVEAMASGKPVIAPNEGGCKETMINGKTGILINEINSDKIVQAIKEINHELKKNPLKYKSFCQKHAKNFDSSIFIKKMKEEIEKQK